MISLQSEKGKKKKKKNALIHASWSHGSYENKDFFWVGYNKFSKQGDCVRTSQFNKIKRDYYPYDHELINIDWQREEPLIYCPHMQRSGPWTYHCMESQVL